MKKPTTSITGNVWKREGSYFLKIYPTEPCQGQLNDTVHRAVMNRFPSTVMQTIVGLKFD